MQERMDGTSESKSHLKNIYFWSQDRKNKCFEQNEGTTFPPDIYIYIQSENLILRYERNCVRLSQQTSKIFRN